MKILYKKPQNSHTVRFHLYEISRIDQFTEQKAHGWLPGAEGNKGGG
jgi:hypothetical protein